jgi:hypothetical protein
LSTTLCSLLHASNHMTRHDTTLSPCPSSSHFTQELKPSRTFRLSEVVAYESTLPLSPSSSSSSSLPARTNKRYATVVSFRTSGEEGLGLTRVRLKSTPTHFIQLLSSEIFTFKVRTSNTSTLILICICLDFYL